MGNSSDNTILQNKKSWNKKDLTNIISKELNIPKSKASEYLNVFVDILHDGLTRGKKITISDFGTFSVSQRSGFKGTHPQTGAPLEVTVRFIPVFKVGKKLKEALNPHLEQTNE